MPFSLKQEAPASVGGGTSLRSFFCEKKINPLPHIFLTKSKNYAIIKLSSNRGKLLSPKHRGTYLQHHHPKHFKPSSAITSTQSLREFLENLRGPRGQRGRRCGIATNLHKGKLEGRKFANPDAAVTTRCIRALFPRLPLTGLASSFCTGDGAGMGCVP